MIVTYEALFLDDGNPALCKVVSTEGTKVITSLSVNNTHEITHLSDELIWQHLENLVSYIKTSSQEISLVDKGVVPRDGWPLVGWRSVVAAQEEALAWWLYITYRDEQVEVIHNIPLYGETNNV